LAIVTESLETSDLRPLLVYYLSFRDINTTVSTWAEFGQLMSDGRFSILRKWEHVQAYRLRR